MKSKIAFGVFIGLMFVFYGCDYIEAPYATDGPQGCTGSTPVFTANPSPVRKVLIEDVTGHRCGNCPRAAETIASIMASYPDQVVALGLHSSLSGSFTDILPNDTITNPSLKYIYDFRNTPSTEIDNQFGVSSIGLPGGMVNRKDFGGGPVVSYTNWSTYTASVLASPPDIDLQLQNFWNTNNDSSLCSYFYARALNSLSGDYKICLFLTEDSIVKWQKDYLASPSTDLQFYVHHHVLRSSITGTTWGVPLNSTTNIASGETFIEGYSTKIDPSLWNLDHLYVVAFVYNATTLEVVQAEELKMLP